MNPYEVLGVSPNVSDDELKKAYRNLAKKYHPDRYSNSPLANSASEKMKQINEAYDIILEQRKRQKSDAGSNYYNTNNNYNYNYNYSSGYTRFDNVRQLIKENNFDEAERILSGISSAERNAEWYYLMGVVVYIKGFLEEAYNYFETACRLDPKNIEYRTFYERIRGQRSGNYYGGYNPRNTEAPCNCCDICTCLICSDCLCDCMKCN